MEFDIRNESTHVQQRLCLMGIRMMRMARMMIQCEYVTITNEKESN